jgi:hypothetical protein
MKYEKTSTNVCRRVAKKGISEYIFYFSGCDEMSGLKAWFRF